MKKILLVTLLGITALVLFLGNQSYSAKIQTVRTEATKVNQQEKEKQLAEEKKRKEAEEAKKKEEKKVYDKHKGETLIYSPMGDSLSEGFYATDEDSMFIQVLANKINEKMGYNVKVQNGAVQAGTGLRNNGIPNVESVLEEQPDLVTIEFGTNDLNEAHTKAYSTPEEFEDRLKSVIDTLQQDTEKIPEIVLVTTWNTAELSLEYDEIITKVGKEKNIQVANIQSVWKDRTNTTGPEGEETFLGERDLFHPNDLGHEEIANAIFNEAYKVLK